MEFLRRTPTGHPALGSATAVTAHAVSAGYDGKPVLHQLSATFPRGQVTALGGPNGAGKSTLLGVLAGTHRPQEGSVTRHPAERIAFVVQRSAVSDRFPLTVRETVAMGRWGEYWLPRPPGRDDRGIIAECLEVLGLDELADRPLGSLSGGQRQRALVGQGLARRSSLLLLDEPIAGVDEHTQQIINTAIRSEADRGATVIVATHDPGQLADADQELTMMGGRITAVRHGATFAAARRDTLLPLDAGR